MKLPLLSLVCCALVSHSFGGPIDRQGPLEEEMSGYFEGDMDMSEEEINALNSRTGLVDVKYRWPNNVVYYHLNDQTDAQKAYIREALDEMEKHLCLKFVPRTTEKNYVDLYSSTSGCSSKVGMRGGAQSMSLASNNPGSGCFRKGTIIHEFIHALGFRHMQSATERDQYVKIMWDNIEPGKESNFNIYDSSLINQFGAPYDYGSVMHYSATAFSMNKEKTIVALDPVGGAEMGQRLGLSAHDITRINNMYC